MVALGTKESVFFVNLFVGHKTVVDIKETVAEQWRQSVQPSVDRLERVDCRYTSIYFSFLFFIPIPSLFSGWIDTTLSLGLLIFIFVVCGCLQRDANLRPWLSVFFFRRFLSLCAGSYELLIDKPVFIFFFRLYCIHRSFFILLFLFYSPPIFHHFPFALPFRSFRALDDPIKGFLVTHGRTHILTRIILSIESSLGSHPVPFSSSSLFDSL